MTIAPQLTDAQRREFVRYTDTRRWPLLGRFPVGDDLHDELVAGMLNCSPDTVRAIAGDLARQARDTAAEMLADRRFRDTLRALPFRPGDRVVAVGDSLTADRLGWFALWSAAAALDRQPTADLVNLGVSGNTTADVLERFDLLATARPEHVLIMLGTNDARLHGRGAAYRMVTAAETERNLRALADLAATELGATVTMITPPAVDQRRIDTHFAGDVVRWRADAVAEVAGIVRRVAPACVDLHGSTRDRVTGDFLGPDGVHPTPAGHRLIVTQVLAGLAAG